MKLLVSGGAGFIGSHFIRFWLARHPQDTVANVDRLTYAGLESRLDDVAASVSYRLIRADICDAAAVEEAMQDADVVVHFAAETHVDRSITDASPFLRTNVEGTYTLLHCARRSRVSRFLHVSTDEVYGPVASGSVDESAPLAPRSPYAASKAAGDLLAQAMHETFGLPILIVRPSNIFGPGQFPEKFIPLCITNCLDGVPVPIYGDGRQRRQWLFVQDACEALEVILENGRVGAIYNLGGESERANLEVAQALRRALGSSEDLLRFVADRPGHDRRYAMSDAKLRALGWAPRTAFEAGLAETITWYRAHPEWWRRLACDLREDSYHWLNRAARSGLGESFRLSR